MKLQQLGISSGHGMKGKQNSLEVDDDLVEMYTEYQSKREILLWCFAIIEENSVPETQKSRKRSRNTSRDPVDGDEPRTTSKREACQKKIQVDDISKLKEKHGSKYSIEQLSAWAHMLHIGKHDSHDTPPNRPFFGRKQSGSDGSGMQQSDRLKGFNASALSPTKRVQLRSECIEQLDRLHSLEKGGIPHEDYDNLQKAILGDIFGNLQQ